MKSKMKEIYLVIGYIDYEGIEIIDDVYYETEKDANKELDEKKKEGFIGYDGMDVIKILKA